MKTKNISYLVVAWFLTCPALALAYIGPGLGAGAVAAVLGTLAGILMLLAGVIWYPIKRLIRRFRSKK
jgi:hypothetical protein